MSTLSTFKDSVLNIKTGKKIEVSDKKLSLYSNKVATNYMIAYKYNSFYPSRSYANVLENIIISKNNFKPEKKIQYFLTYYVLEKISKYSARYYSDVKHLLNRYDDDGEMIETFGEISVALINPVINYIFKYVRMNKVPELKDIYNDLTNDFEPNENVNNDDLMFYHILIQDNIATLSVLVYKLLTLILTGGYEEHLNMIVKITDELYAFIKHLLNVEIIDTPITSKLKTDSNIVELERCYIREKSNKIIVDINFGRDMLNDLNKAHNIVNTLTYSNYLSDGDISINDKNPKKILMYWNNEMLDKLYFYGEGGYLHISYAMIKKMVEEGYSKLNIKIKDTTIEIDLSNYINRKRKNLFPGDIDLEQKYLYDTMADEKIKWFIGTFKYFISETNKEFYCSLTAFRESEVRDNIEKLITLNNEKSLKHLYKVFNGEGGKDEIETFDTFYKCIMKIYEIFYQPDQTDFMAAMGILVNMAKENDLSCEL